MFLIKSLFVSGTDSSLHSHILQNKLPMDFPKRGSIMNTKKITAGALLLMGCLAAIPAANADMHDAIKEERHAREEMHDAYKADRDAYKHRLRGDHFRARLNEKHARHERERAYKHAREAARERADWD
jgi:hypothetical protein